ncbi:DoxX family protein [Chryseobacterium oncorhynchi]|uniref:DoxX family protein n=1 Tax=Chryseobacterium oncorhynchi TaxID=741074 RepID=A0A316WF08_9FLAO|nr:hypothetical protein [Chryseobacterium oncorhynchi]PWN60055.1 hypothetical protein C1638_021035 [Chryseobacterium oncorhynchi]
MKPLFVLIVVFILFLVATKLIKGQCDVNLSGRAALAAMFIFTSIGHFVFTKGMSLMMPDIIPYKFQIIIASGILELVFACAVLFLHDRFAGWIIIAFLILVLPANIKAAFENINYETAEHNGSGLKYLFWFRIPFQLFLIGWIYFFLIRK